MISSHALVQTGPSTPLPRAPHSLVRTDTPRSSLGPGPQRKVALMASSETNRDQGTLQGPTARTGLSWGPGGTVRWTENLGPLCCLRIRFSFLDFKPLEGKNSDPFTTVQPGEENTNAVKTSLHKTARTGWLGRPRRASSTD